MTDNCLYAAVVAIFILLTIFPYKIWSQRYKKQLLNDEQQFERELKKYFVTARSNIENYHVLISVVFFVFVFLTVFFVLFLTGTNKRYYFWGCIVVFMVPYLMLGSDLVEKINDAIIETSRLIFHLGFKFFLLIILSILIIFASIGIAYLFDIQNLLELIDIYLKPILNSG